MDDNTVCELSIFPRYLKLPEPGDSFVAGGDLGWLDNLEPEVFPLNFRHGRLGH